MRHPNANFSLVNVTRYTINLWTRLTKTGFEQDGADNCEFDIISKHDFFFIDLSNSVES